MEVDHVDRDEAQLDRRRPLADVEASGGGGGGGAEPMGVVMSTGSRCALSPVVDRTSSIRPAKYSPHAAFPPIRSGMVGGDEGTAAVTAADLAAIDIEARVPPS